MPDLKKYQVILSDGTERTIWAQDVEVEDSGALILLNGVEVQAAYAPATWLMVQLERHDGNKQTPTRVPQDLG
jgi:hypothetical protein